MSLQFLAASSRPLAEALLDRLRDGAGFSRLAGEIPPVEDDEGQRLDENHDDAERHLSKPRASCAPDAAASAILLGRSFENSRDVLARLAEPDMVAIIQVADPDLVKPIRRMLRMLLASDATLIDGEISPTAFPPRRRPILSSCSRIAENRRSLRRTTRRSRPR
jgi:hypothetical protein